MATDNTAPSLDSDAIPPIVLLVEDDRDTLEMYSAFFEMSGMWVATSTAPVEAINAVEELQPDVIVTDIVFGGRPLGIELLQALKSRAATRQIPVVMLSGRSREDLPSAARQAVDVYLEKPVLPDLLFESVRSLVGRSRALRQRGQPARDGSPPEPGPAAIRAAGPKPLPVPPSDHLRSCPECSGPLEWIERGRIGGADYDYYRWCFKGCGLFCYDRDAAKWVKLA